MKKCVCILLVLLLLTGCAGQSQNLEQTQTEPAPETLYDSTHRLQSSTGGAVRVSVLKHEGYQDMFAMGSKVLLLKESGEAIVLQGDESEVIAAGTVEGYRSGAASFAVNVKGLANYLPESREVILLNPQLHETNRLQLPEDIQGEPVISLESNEIFFCRNGEIRAMNMENGVARLIKSHIVSEQTLDGCYFDGKVIRCSAKDQEGNLRLMYIDARNGSTLSEDACVYAMETLGERHFVRRMDNLLDQIIVGTMTGESQLMVLPQEMAEPVFPVLTLDGAVSYQVGNDGITLSFQDLEAGNTTASVELAQVSEPAAVAADQRDIWVLTDETVTAEDGQTATRQLLVRWNIKKSILLNAVPVLQTLYTAQNPDTEGLKLCKEQANSVGETYGVRISVWEDAVKTTGDYTAVAEHQPVILTDMLTAVENAVTPYPESFLRKIVKTGWIRICLVRSIAGGQDYAQFWNKGDCYLLISSQANIAEAVEKTVTHALDSRVLGNSRRYDNWNELNPEGFVYTAELEADTQDASAYLEGENRAFVNAESVASASEDRCQLFLAAMAEGNEAVFTSNTMQAKLRRMCEAIREAYDMQNKKEIMPWERYLSEPLVQIEDNNG